MLEPATILAGTLAFSPSPAAPVSPPDPSPDRSEEGSRASAEAPYRTVVEAERGKLAGQRRIDRLTPGFGTAIDLDDASETRPGDDLGRVLARTPGAYVRSLGGLGQFTAVSLRGSTPTQVGIFLDGVPLSDGLTGLVDLSDIPIDALRSIEIYRGYVPIAFGAAAIGGAINLVSRSAARGPRARMVAGVGSFGARHSLASLETRVRPHLTIATRLAYRAAEGRFPFYDDGGTPSDPRDDGTTLRRNNDYTQGLAQLRIDGDRGHTHYGMQAWGVLRSQGVAGRARPQALGARLVRTATQLTGHVERRAFAGAGGRIGARFGFGVQHQRFRDPDGEVGLGRDDERVLALDGFVATDLRLPLWRGAFVGTVAELRPQWIDVVDPREARARARHGRETIAVGVELEQFLFERRIRLVPAMRIDALHQQREGARGGKGGAFVVGYAPRLGARVRVLPGLELRGSGGRYFRPPTLLELFGDRGDAVGNPDLVPERGTAVDGGVVVDLAGAGIDVHGHAAGFATWSEDLIQWIVAGPVSRSENAAAARIRGLEAALAVLPVRGVSLRVTYTFTDSEDRSDDPTRRGHPLPGRPRHALLVIGMAEWPCFVRGFEIAPRIRYGFEVVTGNLLDPSGRAELPPRVLQDVAIDLVLARRVRLTFDVRNLLDVRTTALRLPTGAGTWVPIAIADVLGFPLPGRSLWASLAIDVL